MLGKRDQAAADRLKRERIPMDRIKEFFRRQGPTVFAMTGAVILIIISLLDFMLQVNSNISADMFHQNQAVLENGVRLLQNEVGYLKMCIRDSATSLSLIYCKDDSDNI